MAGPNYYRYGNLITISCVFLLIAEIGAIDNGEAGSLLGGKKLIIGLPKKTGFTQFVDLQSNENQIVKVTGYSIDVFHAAIAHLKSLHYNISFEFRAFVDEDGNSAGTYDALVHQIFEGKAFPNGSNLTSYFSRAILNVRESEEMDNIEEKYFGSNHEGNEGQGLSSSSSSDDASSNLTTYSFAGLFMVVGILSLLALVVSESHIWQRHVMLARTYSRQLLVSWSFTRTSPLEGGSATRRNVDGEGFTIRENDQNFGLETEHV